MAESMDRRLSWEACFNARDLGGYAAEDGRQIVAGRLVRSDNLGHLTPAGQRALIDYGISCIIDLRAGWERTNFPHFFQSANLLRPLHYGLALEDDEDAERTAMRDAAGSLTEWNCLVLDQSQAQIAAILRFFAQSPPGGVLIHCHAGKDRTGLVVALLLALASVPHSLIAEDYAVSEAHILPMYTDWLAEAGDDLEERAKRAQWVAAQPATMLATLAYLDAQYDGIEAYLRSAGMTIAELRAIRARLLEP